MSEFLRLGLSQCGPWLWSPARDLAAFGGSAVFALLVSWAAYGAGTHQVPVWAWLVFVLGLDVAHVWSTIFRTYLDREEFSQRRKLYLLLPLVCYVVGVGLHQLGALTFWRVLAYAAVFHFVRQQVGWVAIYRVRAGERDAIDRRIDTAVSYGATCFPLLYWHVHLPRRFTWFVTGDFFDLSRLAPLVWPAGALYVVLLLAYFGRAVQRGLQGHRINLGKHCVVLSTAVIWHVGIVMSNDDFTFTVTNVCIHAVPYFALLWAYSRERAIERPASNVAKVLRFGVAGFFGVALMFAFAEELLWDRFVWQEHDSIFGVSGPPLSDLALSYLVPLLTLPQAVHYVLDGVLWRGKDAGPAQARALGFSPAAGYPSQVMPP